MPGYKNFPFPLNVYSHVLHLDFGDFQYLHYGLFEPGLENVIEAQEHASEILISRLPPCPCRLLEVGIGLGATLSRLVQAGYEAIGITPDENQLRYAKNHHVEHLPVLLSSLEDFSNNRKFNLIIFQESAQYINTAILFHKALELLEEDGHILIMDEVSLRRNLPSEPGLPLLDDYVSLGNTAGFDILERLDLSTLAAPTNTYIVDAVSKHRGRLIMDLGLSEGEIDGLLNSGRTYLDKYRDGRYGYALLHFQRAKA